MMQTKIREWDLWMVWTDEIDGRYEELDLGGMYPETRIYARIPKSSIWFVGERRLEFSDSGRVLENPKFASPDDYLTYRIKGDIIK